MKPATFVDPHPATRHKLASAPGHLHSPGRRHISVWLTALVSIAAAVGSAAQENNPVLREHGAAPSGAPGILVKLRAGNGVGQLAARAGVVVREERALPAGLRALQLDSTTRGPTFSEQLERLRSDPSVEYAESDQRRYPHALPNDPRYVGQWYLQSRADAPSAINAESAWDGGGGSAGVVIAIIDTGVLYEHPDLERAAAGGRLLPGYDFVANVAAANDGNGRDADATDPGDWVTQPESLSGQFSGCARADSSWHGTRVAGILGARTNNSEGIAGTTWSPWLLPVRALGKFGGLDSDILAAMAWAAGLHVDGVPDNPYPAKILNLGSGALGSCPSSYQTLIGELTARGVLVVVSAGNEGGPVAAPANCPGVAAVAGLRHTGTKVGFSNLGPEITVGAPAGDCVNVIPNLPCLFSIDTTYDVGTTTPTNFGYTDQLNANVGTSFAAPIVAGIAALMVSANGNLGAAQLIARIRAGAKTPFPVSADTTVAMCHVPAGTSDIQSGECNCTTSTCGAGMANAQGALAAARRPIAVVTPPAIVRGGTVATLSAVGSAGACGRTITSYSWASVSGAAYLSTPTDQPTVGVSAPMSEGMFTLRLTVTDDIGASDFADIRFTSVSATTTAPAAAGTNACLTAIPPPAAESAAVSPSVAISPLTASLVLSQTVVFAATVANAVDTSVTWQVAGVTGGNVTFGTISTAGVYTAPATLPSPPTVTVTAVAVADPATSASARVTLSQASSSVDEPAQSGGGGAIDLLMLLGLLVGHRFARRIHDRPNTARRHTRRWSEVTQRF